MTFESDRKQTTDAADPLDIAEVELRHRQILDSAVDTAIIGTDTAGRVLTWSEGASNILGWSETEMFGKSLECIFTPEDLARNVLRSEIDEALLGGREGHEGWRIRKDGTRFWAIGEMSPIRDRSGAIVGLVKVLRDHSRQKDAERSLRENEQYLRQITEALPGFTWIADNTGKVEFMSAGWERYTGTPAEASMGDNWKASLHPDDYGRITWEWAEATRIQQSYEAEMRYRGADGAYRWYLSRAQPIRNSEGEVTRWIGVSFDIDDRKTAQERSDEETRVLEILNRAASTLATEVDIQVLVQAVTDAGVELAKAEFGAFFYNAQDATGEGYMLYSLSGADPSDFEGFPMPPNTAILASMFAGTDVIRSDDIIKDPNYGKNAPYYGMPRGHLPVRSYLAVPVIARNGQVLGGLFFGHSTPGIFLERTEKLISNLAAEAAIAIENARLLQALQQEVKQRTKAEAALQALNATLEQQITERTEQLRVNEEALRHAQKLEALGQLTGGIAHDFNNLLQIVIGNLEILQRKLPQDVDRSLRAVNQAMTGARRAAVLTRHLLAFSRRQALDPKPTNAKDLISRTANLLSRALGEPFELKVTLASDLWNVEVDESQFENALLNLSLNARDAMPNGGSIEILALNENVTTPNVDTGSVIAPGEYLHIALTDTGTGMAPDIVSHAFEPFFTTKTVGKGTGLGLSQVYGFVKQSGGHISIKSALGEGTTINIWLPRFAGDLPAEQDAVETNLPRSKGNETILVVEDDDDVRAFSVETLRDLGYKVIEAHDAAVALHFLAKDQRVDLLFSDVVLTGDLNGADLAARVRALRPDTKVLLTSGYARNLVMNNRRLDKGVFLIPKPFNSHDLAERVKAILSS